MNPYTTLSKLGAFHSYNATFIKSDGEEIPLLVKPESVETEQLNEFGGSTPLFDSYSVTRSRGGYIGSVKMRVWSTSTTNLNPEKGDCLVIKSEDGAIKRYTIVKNASTARYWDWRYTRETGRIVFYTMF